MINLKNSIGGEFEFYINRDPANKESKPVKVAESKNIILDVFLNALNNYYSASINPGDSRYAFAGCAVGSGVTAPLPSDIGLESEIYKSSRSGLLNLDNYTTLYDSNTKILTAKLELRYIFNIGEVVGNVSEVGLYGGSTAGNFFHNRALVRDSGGNPTTIAVLSTDQLIVNYKLTVSIPTRATASITAGGALRQLTLAKVAAPSKPSFSQTPWYFTAANGFKALPSQLGVDYGQTNELPDLNSSSWPSRAQSYSNSNSTSAGLEGGGCTATVSVNTGVFTNETDGIGVLYSKANVRGSDVWALRIDPPIQKSPTEFIEFKVKTTWSRS